MLASSPCSPKAFSPHQAGTMPPNIARKKWEKKCHGTYLFKKPWGPKNTTITDVSLLILVSLHMPVSLFFLILISLHMPVCLSLFILVSLHMPVSLSFFSSWSLFTCLSLFFLILITLHMSVCISLFMLVSLHMSVSLSFFSSWSLFTCLSLSFFSSWSLFTCLSVSLSLFMLISLHMSVCLSLFIFVSLLTCFVSLNVYLCLFSFLSLSLLFARSFSLLFHNSLLFFSLALLSLFKALSSLSSKLSSFSLQGSLRSLCKTFCSQLSANVHSFSRLSRSLSLHAKVWLALKWKARMPWPTRWMANCSYHAERICTNVLWCVAVAVAVAVAVVMWCVVVCCVVQCCGVCCGVVCGYPSKRFMVTPVVGPRLFFNFSPSWHSKHCAEIRVSTAFETIAKKDAQCPRAISNVSWIVREHKRRKKWMLRKENKIARQWLSLKNQKNSVNVDKLHHQWFYHNYGLN